MIAPEKDTADYFQLNKQSFQWYRTSGNYFIVKAVNKKQIVNK
jgi:hypothetical protein